MREHMRAGLDELHRHGLTGRFEYRGKHPALVFLHDVQEHRVTCAFSPRCSGKAAIRLRVAVRRALAGERADA